MKDSSRIAQNFIWTGISVMISTTVSFLLTPYVTSQLGIEANGFVSLANTCITYIDIITIAINAFAARFIAIEYHNERFEEANSYYSSVVIANLILSVILDAVGFAIISRLETMLNISDYMIGDVKALFLFVLINYTIGIVGTTFTVVAFIKNRISITYRNTGLSKLIYVAVLIALIYLYHIHVYSMAIASCFATCSLIFLNCFYTKGLAPELKVRFRNFSIDKIKRLVSSGIWNSINNIGNLLNSGLDLLVCNKLLSELITGQVSIGKQIAIMMTTFTGIAVNAFQPKQLELYAKRDIGGLANCLRMSMRFTGTIGNIFFACFIALGYPFLNLWIPGQNISKIYALTVIIMIGDVLVSAVRPLYYVFTLTDRLKSVCWITICSGIMNIVSMIVLLKYTHLEGYAVVGTTMILNLVVQFWAAPYFAKRYLKFKHNPFMPVVVRHILVCFMATFILYMIFRMIRIESWFGFMLSGLVAVVICTGIVVVLELDTADKKQIMGVIEERIQR